MLPFGCACRDFPDRSDPHEPGVQILQGRGGIRDFDVRGCFCGDRRSRHLQRFPVTELFGRGLSNCGKRGRIESDKP